jgi:hypothetical protein
MKCFLIITVIVLLISGENLIGQSNSKKDQVTDHTLDEVVSICFEYWLNKKAGSEISETLKVGKVDFQSLKYQEDSLQTEEFYLIENRGEEIKKIIFMDTTYSMEIPVYYLEVLSKKNFIIYFIIKNLDSNWKKKQDKITNLNTEGVILVNKKIKQNIYIGFDPNSLSNIGGIRSIILLDENLSAKKHMMFFNRDLKYKTNVVMENGHVICEKSYKIDSGYSLSENTTINELMVQFDAGFEGDFKILYPFIKPQISKYPLWSYTRVPLYFPTALLLVNKEKGIVEFNFERGNNPQRFQIDSRIRGELEEFGLW